MTSFVNKEKLYFMGDYPGKLVVFLAGVPTEIHREIFNNTFEKVLGDKVSTLDFDSLIDDYNDVYYNTMLNKILEFAISGIDYVVISDWFTPEEYEVLAENDLLYVITMGYQREEFSYDFIIQKNLSLEKQLVDFIEKLKKGE